MQGWGKTALTTWMGKRMYEGGYDIYSNYPVNFPHTLVTSLKEAKGVRNGYLLFDEFWRWVHARTSQSNINKEMMAICLLNRKRNVSIIYNTQLPRTIDVILRDVTLYRYLPKIKTHKDGFRYIHYIMRDLLDRESPEMFVTMPIHEIGKLYNTNYEVGDIENDSDNSFLEKTLILENHCINALKKIKGINVNLLPDSGKGTGFKGDILINFKGVNYIADVKSTADSGEVIFCDPSSSVKNEMNKFNSEAKKWNFKPLLFFPKIKKHGNYLNYPTNWYGYKLNGNSYLFDLVNHKARYNKLIKQSFFLKNWENIA